MSDDNDFADQRKKYRQKQHSAYKPDWEDDERFTISGRKPASEFSNVHLASPPTVKSFG